MRRIPRLAIGTSGTGVATASGWGPVIAAGVLAVSGMLVGCGSAATEPVAQPTDLAEANPAVAEGADIYAASCASCHGADLRGTDKGPSHLSVVYEPNHHGDASFRSAISNGAKQHHWGFGDMEPIVGLSDAQIDAVIAFVRAEQQRLGFEQ